MQLLQITIHYWYYVTLQISKLVCLEENRLNDKQFFTMKKN